MRLVVDLQGAQGSNRIREIGRYCLLLTYGLARLRGKHEVIVVLSALFPDTIEPLRRSLEEVLPPEAIRIMHLMGPVPNADPNCDARREAAELMREHFLASLDPDFVLITSLFEGFEDDVVSSIGLYSTRIATATVLYDLIPPINRDTYLPNSVRAKWYERKLAHLRRADLLLAVSQSSRCEAIEWFGAVEDETANISIGVEDHFTPASVSAERRSALARDYGLVRPFIMCTGGIDHPKNIEGLIEAYAMMPLALRQGHQLAILTSSITLPDRQRLKALASRHGLSSDELVLVDSISEADLLTCYQACKLFVLLSWHEGGGLTALQVMRCGRAIIASNQSSLPDVIGMSQALFDPYDIGAMSKNIGVLLTDDVLRARLEEYGQEQAKRFSWDVTAQAAWNAVIAAHDRRTVNASDRSFVSRKPRLAYVSPLSLEASDCGAGLLPELARHYRIDVIVHQQEVSDVAIAANYPIRSVEWFRQHAHAFDRILYHFSNSPFHSYMLDLIVDYPAMVVLHDFFLSDIVVHRDVHGKDPGGWARALFEAHGWPAVVHRFKAPDTADVVLAYPCNMAVLQNALGVIVHTDFSRQLAQIHYGRGAGDDWTLIPYLLRPAPRPNRSVARKILGFGPHDFVVCSFGILGSTMMNDRLLSAWLASPLADNPNCHLIFLDQNDRYACSEDLERCIRACRSAVRIEITRWTDRTTFRHWLAAADIGVQLRAISYGETSTTVLDCMDMGLPTIVNANGSMAELPSDCVWLMPDDFREEDLIEALGTLYADAVRRCDMSEQAGAWIARQNNPRLCAAVYAQAIEAAYIQAETGQTGLERALTEHGHGEGLNEDDWRNLALAMGRNVPPALRRKKLLVDISELVQRDCRSGIQRVVRSILGHWLPNPPADYIVEPLYAVLNESGYRYARRFTSQMLDISYSWCEDEVVEPMAGDIFIGIDLQPMIVPQQKELLQEWRRMGVIIRFVIHDLLPVLRPEFFGPGAKTNHHAWLETISHYDGVICVSRTVADEYRDWLDHYGPARVTPLDIDWFHHGCDVEKQPASSKDMPDDAQEMLAKLHNTMSFLSVSTIEPRKGFRQTLDAMERLWAKGVDVNFVIVGRPGWMMDDFIARLQSHAELGKRLLWLQGISDAYLYAIYGACRYLVAASQGEGFGLPLVEAARHDLPVLARDIAVFREVAGNAATYFPDSEDPAVLERAIEDLLKPQKGSVKPQGMKWMTWAQSADALLACATRRNSPYLRWMPDSAHRFWGNDHRLQSQVGVLDGTHVRTSAQAGFLTFGPYIPLDPGSWTIKAEGDVTHLDGSEVIEIVSNSGADVHFSMALTRVDERWIVEGDYGLDKHADNIEVRLWVSDASILSLSRISLTPNVIQSIDDRQAVRY